MKAVHIFGFVCSFVISACGAAPTTPVPSVFTLSGRVTESAPTETVALAGARVEVLDGLRAGTVVVADAEGRFTVGGVSGLFSVGVRAAGYEDATVQVDASGGDVSRSVGLRPVFKTIAETIGTPLGPRRAATSFFRNVHHDGVIVVSRLYFYYSQDKSNPLTRTIEIWNGQQLVGSAAVNKQQWTGLDLLLRVPGGARYEIRITGGDWSAVTIESPN